MSMRSVLIASLVLTLGLWAAACGSPTSATTVSAITISGTPPTVGTTAQFAATATVSGGVEDVTTTATWTSSNTTIATVSSTGLVTGIASGSAVITATYSNISGTDSITVP